MSQLEGGAAEDKSEFDLAVLVAEVVHEADLQARARNRRVHSASAPYLQLPWHRVLLRRPLENVGRNAVRDRAEDLPPTPRPGTRPPGSRPGRRG